MCAFYLDRSESKQVIHNSGLTDMVEFRVGGPYKLLAECENVNFSIFDCNSETCAGLLGLLNPNPQKSVVVLNSMEASGTKTR